MTAAAHKLAELLILARRIGYEPDCFAATRAPAGLSVGDLEDFARLHAEVVALLAAGAELEGVKREREALKRQTRREAGYLERCFDDLRHAETVSECLRDDLRHAEELVEELRAERDEAREVARDLLELGQPDTLDQPRWDTVRELVRAWPDLSL